MTAKNLLSLLYDKDGPTLSVLDQLLIPDKKEYVPIPNVEAAWTVIRSMQIRGAPLIAMVACLGLAVDLKTNPSTLEQLATIKEGDGPAVLSFIQAKMEYLATSRPTAVNLFNALKELQQMLEQVDNVSSSNTTLKTDMIQAVVSHAEFMLKRDVSDNEAIGQHGADEICQKIGGDDAAKVTMVTICNTGSLATAGFGTALGVARALQQRNRLQSIVALETRPYNQGSRLTAFEIVEESMPGGMLICDSAAATFMKTKGVDAVVVGADRVCANGDTANKIGTYSLAIAAAGHGVPFYVASPFTTLDCSLQTGDNVEIEERSPDEILQTSRAPSTIACWNPAFDVTPARYISGIITEKGVIHPNVDGTIDVAAFVEKHKTTSTTETTTSKSRLLMRRLSSLVIPVDYIEQTTQTLPVYLSRTSPAVLEVLGAQSCTQLSLEELGDGNLDHVWLVTNNESGRKVIVKQATPYVRMVMEPTSMSPDRAWHEYRALVALKDACPDSVPHVHFFSKAHGLVVMEYIPHSLNLRQGLLQGIQYPTIGSDMGVFLARTLFKTSGFQLSESQLRNEVEFWSTNLEMCALTEQMVFVEPYMNTPNNQWTSPQLDQDKHSLETDVALKLAISKLKTKFVTQTQALLHGDLNSSSVMCSDTKTFVIDPKYSLYGPMGFDTGSFVASLLLAYVSQPGHDGHEAGYGDWLLEQLQVFYKTFQEEFIKLWKDPKEHVGMCYPTKLFLENDQQEACRADFFPQLWKDTLGFCGAKMIRRIVGNAHVSDLTCIENVEVRARCERHGLEIAKNLVKNAAKFTSMQDVINMVKDSNTK